MRTSTIQPSWQSKSGDRAGKRKLIFPEHSQPLFCSFNAAISNRVNRVGYCNYLQLNYINLYDLSFCRNKEVWVFWCGGLKTPSLDLAWKLLQQGAYKVQVHYFPVGGDDNE
jgi:hypothetical protein